MLTLLTAMPASQGAHIVTFVRLSADYIVTVSIYHGWQLRFIQYALSAPPGFCCTCNSAGISPRRFAGS
jgi:hypothetical protein